MVETQTRVGRGDRAQTLTTSARFSRRPTPLPSPQTTKHRLVSPSRRDVTIRPVRCAGGARGPAGFSLGSCWLPGWVRSHHRDRVCPRKRTQPAAARGAGLASWGHARNEPNEPSGAVPRSPNEPNPPMRALSRGAARPLASTTKLSKSRSARNLRNARRSGFLRTSPSQRTCHVREPSPRNLNRAGPGPS